MDPTSVIGLLIVLVVAAAAWTRPAATADEINAPVTVHRVVVEELDDQGRVTRRVVL